jgi:hypothetical protein
MLGYLGHHDSYYELKIHVVADVPVPYFPITQLAAPKQKSYQSIDEGMMRKLWKSSDAFAGL